MGFSRSFSSASAAGSGSRTDSSRRSRVLDGDQTKDETPCFTRVSGCASPPAMLYAHTCAVEIDSFLSFSTAGISREATKHSRLPSGDQAGEPADPAPGADSRIGAVPPIDVDAIHTLASEVSDSRSFWVWVQHT